MDNDVILSCAFLTIIITTLLLLTALACSAYFIFKTTVLWKSRKDLTQKTNQSFLLFNMMTIIVFVLAAIFIWVECLSTIITTPYDFFINFGTKFGGVILFLYFAMLLYLFGKYCLYFVLYLRLKLVLNDSIFAFAPHQYKIIKSIIWLGIIFGILSTLMVSLPWPPDITMMYTIRVVVYSTYLLLDLLAPIWLNTMFVWKFLQIGKFLQDTRDQLSVGQRSHPEQSPNINHTSTERHASEKTKAKAKSFKKEKTSKLAMVVIVSNSIISCDQCDGKNHNCIHNQSNMEGRDKNTDVNTSENRENVTNSSANRSKNNNETKNYNISSKNNNDNDNNNDNTQNNSHVLEGDDNHSMNQNQNININRKLLNKLSRYTLLSIIVAISTMSVIIGLILTIWYINSHDSENIKEPGFEWPLLLVDSCVNTICLVLYFPISKWIMDKYLCCHNQLQLKYLLKCVEKYYA